MYLVDANVLIEAKNRYYAFDIAPGFWRWLLDRHAAGRVYTVPRVFEEVIGTGDELSDWVRALPSTFSIAATPADQPHLAALAAWANTRQYSAAAVATFLASADYLLVAQAARLGYSVVTHEVPAPDSVKNVKIPDACTALGVATTTTFELMRAEGARLTL